MHKSILTATFTQNQQTLENVIVNLSSMHTLSDGDCVAILRHCMYRIRDPRTPALAWQLCFLLPETGFCS